MGTPSMQHQISGFAIDADAAVIGGFDASSVRLEFISEDVKLRQTYRELQGMRGTRSLNSDRARITTEQVSGTILAEPTAIELDTLLPWILGANESADTFALAETLQTRSLLFDRVANRHIYTLCSINRATFSARAGGVVQLLLEVEGSDEVQTNTAVPGTVPAVDLAGAPYVMGDVTFALGADASIDEISSFSITIDNQLVVDRYMNSVTRLQIPSGGRVITVNMTLPYNADSVDLHDQAVAGSTGSLTLTNGGVSTIFTFANLKSPAMTPSAGARNSELPIELNMTAYRVESTDTDELVVTHDSVA